MKRFAPFARLSLSIRSTVLLAIVLGLITPAVLLLVVESRLARQTQEPLVQRGREAMLAVAAGAINEAMWTLNDASLRNTLAGVLAEGNVCGVEVLEQRPGAIPLRLDKCQPGVPVAQRSAAVVHEGQTLGEIRIRFNDTEIDTLLADRRAIVLRLVLAQVLAGTLVLLVVLYTRLLRPIDRLKTQASAIATRGPAGTIDWNRSDELGELGQHLNSVRMRIDELFGQLETKNAELHKLAMFDQLTGLPNRTLFRELYQHEAHSARRAGQSMALLFIDLDRFKAVNDSLGHEAGDRLLLAVSQRLVQALRQSDLVCRHSGDEFLVLLPHAEPWESVAVTAERMLASIQEPVRLGADGSQLAQVGASIGIALFPRDGDDFDMLVRHADMAMYQAKTQGGRCSFFHAALNDSLRERLETERELAHAIAHDELVLYYQPIFDARTLELRSFEALVRWQHPVRGLLPPGEFIAVAEESGQIRELGSWTLRTACAQIAQWKHSGLAPHRVAVNVSALQFRDQHLVTAVQTALSANGLQAHEIEIELTESTLMADNDLAQGIVTSLREIGVALVVDDFGIGFSSLSYLKRLRPDKLKIDRGFVRDLPDDADDCSLTEAILRMAQALGIRVVAEGVETAAQRDYLQGQGCDLLQGYLLGRPEPAEAAAARMALAEQNKGTLPA